MDKQTQDRAREVSIKRLEERAFEMLALYSYWGEKYSVIDKQLEGMSEFVGGLKKQIAEIEGSTDYHKAQNREKVRFLRSDMEGYEARIKKVGELANELFKKSTAYREEGVTCLEQLEFMGKFSMKTPEEIAADQAKKAGETQISDPVAK